MTDKTTSLLLKWWNFLLSVMHFKCVDPILGYINAKIFLTGFFSFGGNGNLFVMKILWVVLGEYINICIIFSCKLKT